MKLTSLVNMYEIESSALDQIKHLQSYPFVEHIAIMPDIHTGYLAPIGTVMLVLDHISPPAIGFDIGCGMCNIDLGFPYNDIIKTSKHAEKVAEKIYENVPVGTGATHVKYEDNIKFKSALDDKNLDSKVNVVINSQFGTLGSGNHFIELGKNRAGNICITVHSGSRNPGHSVCEWYTDLMKKEGLINFIPLDHFLAKAYIEDMNFMLQYALDNRKQIIKLILNTLRFEDWEINKYLLNIINENHNHAEYFGAGRVIHRKGATPAEKGQLGVIPGSMKTGVYITVGLGNEEYLHSASHGAGRKMSRKKAKELIKNNPEKLEIIKKEMKGIIAKSDASVYDEFDFAYKPIEEVIKKQDGIVVNVIDHISSLINIKG